MFMGPPTQGLSDPPWYFSICFKLSPISCVAMKKYFKNYVSSGKMWFMKLYFFFCLCYPILFNYITYNMICLINYDVHFGWWRYSGALFLDLLGRYNKRVYKTIWSVFQRKHYYMLSWSYNLFITQVYIYILYKSTRWQCGC